jgi:hypothetical protein
MSCSLPRPILSYSWAARGTGCWASGRARCVGDMCLMLACKSKSGMAMCWKRLCTWLGQRAPVGKVHIGTDTNTYVLVLAS